MKPTWLILIFSMTILFPSCKAEGVDVFIELNDSADYYRVRIENRGEREAAFNELSFFIPIEGGAPMGGRIVVRDRNDQEVYSGAGKGHGYSSNDMVSQIFPKREPNWRSVAPGEAHGSQWFSLRDLMQGLEVAAEEPDRKKWKDFKLLFTLDIKNEKPARTVMSDWFRYGE